MSGSANGRQAPGNPERLPDPDSLEVVPGFAHEKLEGWIPEVAGEEDLRQALEKAFDYRGDVTITRKDGTKVEGYIFDRRTGKTLAESGRDTAAGRSWEAWVRKYWEKKTAGEGNIGIQAEKLE